MERARQRKAEKFGGKLLRIELSAADLRVHQDPAEILALDDALEQLVRDEPEAAELVKLRIFADFSVEEADEYQRANSEKHKQPCSAGRIIS